MRCEEAREHLADHLLGNLEEAVDGAVRRHLRGCAGCRAELAALSEGVATLALAAHDVEPPEELRGKVLAVLEEEWGEAATRRSGRRPRIARVAVAAAFAATLVWAGVATVQAVRFHTDASKYETFLGVLGGEDVRVGELRATGSQDLQGSVVIYDSRVGQSWVLVLCRAPGWEGTANVTMVADGERTIDLHPLEFGSGGEASTWLVTATNLEAYDRVNVWDDSGLMARAEVERA